MDTPTKPPPTRTSSGERVAPRLGGLRLVRRLGVGGMGAVWLGLDDQLGVSRAVKVLSASADPELRLRFRREAEAMARVDDHPGVVRVHAAGEEDGWAYLVMDCAPGGDLEARLRRGPLPAAEVVDLGLALASALAHVHSKGVLHRDLKPANVLFDEGGAPRLVDFGLARLSGRDRLTQTGTALGTPTHMAPEQALGLPADVRTDVFGLGAVLYHALTGRAPAAEGPLMTVLAEVIERPPPWPSTVVPGVEPALEAVIMRALAKAPEERFPSADALALALEPLMVADGAPAPPARRTMTAGTLVGVAVVLVVAAGAFVLVKPRGERGESRPAGAGSGPPRSTSVAPPLPTPPPPTSTLTLPETELRAALLADHGQRGLALLERACPGGALEPDAAAWAAALVWLSGDLELAPGWAARAPAGPGGDWLRAAAHVAGGSRPASMSAADAALRGVEDAARAVDGWTHGLNPSHAGEALEPLERLQRAAESVARSADGPIGLAAGVRAQRRLAALYPDIVLLLHVVQDLPGPLERSRVALEAGDALARGSRPGLALRTLAMYGRSRWAPPSAGLGAEIDAVPTDGPYAWVHGLFGGVWLACAAGQLEQPDDAHLDEVRVRWRAFEALARAERLIGEHDEEPTSAGGKLDFLLHHAMNWRSEALFLHAYDVRAADPAGRASDEALQAALELPTRTHWSVRNQGRMHLFRGELDALAALLETGSRHHRSDWFVALKVERAIATKDAAGLRQLLLLPGAQAHQALGLWRAILAAFEGDHAGAEERVDDVKSEPDIRLPWRRKAETRELLVALREGRWTPDGRPFVSR